MKILIQIGFILFICWISQIVEWLLPFSFPASVIGMILLFFLLYFRLVRPAQLKEFATFLLSNMAFFFIPAGVNLMNYFDLLKDNIFPLLLICILSTLVTFFVTFGSAKFWMKWMKKRRDLHG